MIDSAIGRAASHAWAADIETYCQQHVHTSAEASAARDALIATVLHSPTSPDAWLAFLAAEDAADAPYCATTEGGKDACGRPLISMQHLYTLAVGVVPRSANLHLESYVRLWLGLARHQWCVT